MSAVVTEPGLYPDMPENLYHSDTGSLSGTSAKYLLPPYCPAIYQHMRQHHRPPTKEMELGTVVHGLLLGTGQPVEVLDYPDYQTKKAQADRDAARKAGKVPMLAHKWNLALAIEAAVRDDDDAGPLFDSGDAEQSMFWIDPEFGIWCRGRIDWLTYFEGQPVIVDVKTCADSSPEKFARSVAEYRYDMQDVHYRQGLAAILGCDWRDVDFVFAAVPTDAPYLVMTYRIEHEKDIANAVEDCRIAREKFRDCTASGVWPKWSAGITPLTLPGYARRRIESEINDYHN